MFKTITFIFILFSLYACSSKNTAADLKTAGAKQLIAAQILEKFENNTLRLSSFNLEGFFFFSSSGKLFAKDIANNKDSGRWDVSEADEICFKMKKWWYGDISCYKVLHDVENIYLTTKDELLAYKAELFQGDFKLLSQDTPINKNTRKSIRISSRDKNLTDGSLSSTNENQINDISSSSIILTHRDRKDSELTVKMIAQDCPGCNLAFSSLSNADLVGANLANADLSGADLSGANLRRANLQGANLEETDLHGAQLPGANLKNSNLLNANFKGANLYKADLTGAQTMGANFEDVILETVKGLK